MSTYLKAFVIAGVGLLISNSSQATTIDWNAWTSATSGIISADSVAVTFTAGGSTDNLVAGYPSYTPSSTYADGAVVSNAPTSTDGIIQLVGGNSNINTVTFSASVVDPVMVIWSLGQPGITAEFDFIGATPTFVAGGPSAEYGGSAITVSGNNVYGNEGNGTVQFIGTYSQISWTNPVREFWYGFNVGIAGTASTVPEPGSLALLGMGLAGLGAMRRKQNVA